MNKHTKHILGLLTLGLSLSLTVHAETLNIDAHVELQNNSDLRFQSGGTGNITFADGTTIKSLTDLGLIWLSGTTSPLDSIGEDGNAYLDKSTSNYYLKAGGVWALLLAV